MKLLAFTGKKGSGKSEASKILFERFNFMPLAFAQPIKDACHAMFGWPMAKFEDPIWKEAIDPFLGFSPRTAMQTLGTEWGRELKSDIWVALALRQVHPDGCNVVITDLRFNNEAQAVKDRGGKIVQIFRSTVEESYDSHKSEKGVAPELVDVWVQNNESLDRLEETLSQALQDLYKADPNATT